MIDEKLALRSEGGSRREVLAALAPLLLLGVGPSLLLGIASIPPYLQRDTYLVPIQLKLGTR